MKYKIKQKYNGKQQQQGSTWTAGKRPKSDHAREQGTTGGSKTSNQADYIYKCNTFINVKMRKM